MPPPDPPMPTVTNMGVIARSVVDKAGAQVYTQHVNTVMSGGFRVSPQQMCEMYNQLSKFQKALKQDIESLIRLRSGLVQQASTSRGHITGMGPEAGGYVAMMDAIYNNTFQGDGSFLQDLITQEANTRAYMYNIWRSNKTYVSTDGDTASRLTNTMKPNS